MIFSICHRCRWHRWQTLSCEYLREFSKKFETALVIYSNQRLGGNWFKKKTRSIKSRDTIPLMTDKIGWSRNRALLVSNSKVPVNDFFTALYSVSVHVRTVNDGGCGWFPRKIFNFPILRAQFFSCGIANTASNHHIILDFRETKCFHFGEMSRAVHITWHGAQINFWRSTSIFNLCLRGLQRDVVYLCWPIAPS